MLCVLRVSKEPCKVKEPYECGQYESTVEFGAEGGDCEHGQRDLVVCRGVVKAKEPYDCGEREKEREPERERERERDLLRHVLKCSKHGTIWKHLQK